MSLHYSASAAAFFDDAIHADLPADAVPISRARHRELLAAQASGAVIVAGDTGAPRIHRPRASIEDSRAQAARRIKREAARRIEAFAPMWRQMNDSRAPSPEGVARFAAIDAIRAASDALETQVARMSAAQLAAFDQADDANWPAPLGDARP